MDVIDEYSRFIKKNQNIVRRSYGLDYAGKDKVYDGKIHIIDLSYSIDKRLNYEEARGLFYTLVDGLLDKINSTDHIKQYFYHTPVSYEDLSIRLSFDYDLNNYLKKNDVRQIVIFENQEMCFIVDKEEVPEVHQREIVPDVFILEGFASKVRTITRKLSNKEKTK